MICPAILKGKLIEKFREHLLNFNYYHIIHEGYNTKCTENRRLNTNEINSIINNFTKANLPIVCMAGSKSRIPFRDYHCAVNLNIENKEAYVYELLVKEPKEKNLLNGLVMALYFPPYNKKYEIKRLVVPLILSDYEFEEGVKVEIIARENKTIIYRNND